MTDDPQVPPPAPSTPPPAPAVPPPQGRAVLRGFLITGGVSAGVALLGLASITAGIGLLIIVPFALIQLAWTLPMYFTFKRKNQVGEAKGALLACALNVVASVGCWIAVTGNLNFK